MAAKSAEVVGKMRAGLGGKVEALKPAKQSGTY
jgi:hypothetical protein